MDTCTGNNTSRWRIEAKNNVLPLRFYSGVNSAPMTSTYVGFVSDGGLDCMELRVCRTSTGKGGFYRAPDASGVKI